jgi:hypothetical protein
VQAIHAYILKSRKHKREQARVLALARLRSTRSNRYFVIVIDDIIIGMPPHIIIIGAPMLIMDIIASQRSFIFGIIALSIGIIFTIMPSAVISHVILHIIGIMPCCIMGIIIGIMPIMFGIMPGIIPPIGIIMPGIIPPIGIMPGMPPIMFGIPPFMGFIGMFIIGFIGMAFMGVPPPVSHRS